MSEFVAITLMPQYTNMLDELFGDELFGFESGLTEKEIDFLDSLSKWDGAFTVEQAKDLVKIHEKASFR